MFLSRPFYLIFECKRILSGIGTILTRADTPLHFSVVNSSWADGAMLGAGSQQCSPQQAAPTLGDGIHLVSEGASLDAPTALHNIGNTCFMIALLQCFKQMLSRLPPELLPKSQRCPLVAALSQRTSTNEDVVRWGCWAYLPIVSQRDACHIVEICLDASGPMHSSCEDGDCYGACET